jgi:hypothetical protein
MSATPATFIPGFCQKSETIARIRAHVQRCSSLPPLKPGEAERLVAEYAAKRGGIRRCPTVFLLPVQG